MSTPSAERRAPSPVTIMMHTRSALFGLLVAVSVATGYGGQHSPAHPEWPPGVRTVPDTSPALSPEDALKTFHLPPGYRVELVAAEPVIQEPVAFDWDMEGRLWAVEMPGWMPDITARGEHDPIGRVVVLEDTNRDGRMDKRTVFADGLVLARSLKVLDGGVLVGEPPYVWLMRDTNGDLRADARELVTDRYGHRDTDPQNNANGFHWSIDNRMYTAGQSDVELRFKNGRFLVEPTLRRGEWGVTHDDAGRIYRNTNESALHVDLVPTFYFARHPNLLRTRGSYERLADDNPELNTVWPVRPNPGTNRAYQTGIDRADGSLARFTSVCAPLVYRGDRLPSELSGNVFVAEPAANLVSRLVVDERGASLRARKAYDHGEFLASTDEWFRPVYLANAPDGALYVADLYRGIIEHRISITMYLRDHIVARRLERPTGLGRIYRIVHETTRLDRHRDVTKASPNELVQLLSHPNGWWRDTAQRLLVERAAWSLAAVPTLRALARDAAEGRTRLLALWTLDGLDAIDRRLVIDALDDPARDVRTAAIRIAERWVEAEDEALRGALSKRMDDEEWSVRRQLAASWGQWPSTARVAPLAAILERWGDDPIVVDAALSGTRGIEEAVLERLLTRDTAPTGSREAAIVMLAATITRGAQDAAAQRLFTLIADGERPGWQRAAALRGVEVALLGSAMPGSRPPQAAPGAATPPPCPTCPGGRAGPGGAYAFTKPAAPAPARVVRTTLRLGREPSPLLRMIDAREALADRAAAVVGRITWPGKAGDAAALAPLTSEEQRRFAAGAEIYRNLCQSCHQADGRGQDKLAPSLIDSELLLSVAEVATRILLNGKEGSVGLMPPIGASLTDEQLASVLTYVRREWSQPGSPVTPAAVAEVRTLTAGRTKPWTDAELREVVSSRAPK
jgi:mono/diheme cytochrome c family protein/glucose/arabinose dehydrogenase